MGHHSEAMDVLRCVTMDSGDESVMIPGEVTMLR